MKYSDQLVEWLVEDGYTHCYFVAGGNIMHLLNSVRSRMECIPVVHEVAAGIAAEYFNELSDPDGPKAFALVTAGPGLTNILTAMAGAYLESRDLLVIGGQVKSADLAGPQLRQRGIQEIDGRAMALPITAASLRIERPRPRAEVMEAVHAGRQGRKAPVFLEVCLDAQAAEAIDDGVQSADAAGPAAIDVSQQVADVLELLEASARPIILIGGGVNRQVARDLLPDLEALGIPLATTWNGADRVASDNPLYFGRPNTWGMRWSNALVQQADLVMAIGTRLGLQQTGFNWQGFAPLAKVVQVDIDESELRKGHPRVDVAVRADAAAFLRAFVDSARQIDLGPARLEWRQWLQFGRDVQHELPLDDPGNTHARGFLSPYAFVDELSEILTDDDVVVPCSSGGAFTVMMQAFRQKDGQLIATDKGLASMGYGLSAAIGAATRFPHRRTTLVEGDGGFAQNLQELGTVSVQHLNLKMFIFANDGYASIRMTQRNYFDGAYVGCDGSTGLGLPDWAALFAAYRIPAHVLDPADPFNERARELMAMPAPAAFIVPIDPEQTFYPKINSRVTADGGMESSPLHGMYPPLEPEVAARVLRHLPETERK